MKQLLYRLPPSLVKDYLVKFNSRQMGREEVCQALGISKTRLYEIRTEWLRDSERFTLEAAGGDHACAWPPECAATALSLIGAAAGPAPVAGAAARASSCVTRARCGLVAIRLGYKALTLLAAVPPKGIRKSSRRTSDFSRKALRIVFRLKSL